MEIKGKTFDIDKLLQKGLVVNTLKLQLLNGILMVLVLKLVRKR